MSDMIVAAVLWHFFTYWRSSNEAGEHNLLSHDIRDNVAGGV